MSCVNSNNPSWSKITVDHKTALEAMEDYRPNSYYDDYSETHYKIKQYVVVSGTPSEDLDDNGRMEISAGSSFVETELYQYEAIEITLPTGVINPKYISQTDDDEALTTTYAITDGSTWGVGDIITMKYK